jgi:membrane protein implicated in regulation of membrane protease activity
LIIIGVILLIIGFITGIAILWTIGIIALVAGVVLALLGMAGHAESGIANTAAAAVAHGGWPCRCSGGAAESGGRERRRGQEREFWGREHRDGSKQAEGAGA